jgi:hypothetical protein
VTNLLAIVKPFWGWIVPTRTACIGCGAPPENRKDVVVGPSVALCRQCFYDAFAALTKNRIDIVPVRGSNLQSVRCSFCGKRSVDQGGLATWPKGAICGDCLLLCDEILLERGV